MNKDENWIPPGYAKNKTLVLLHDTYEWTTKRCVQDILHGLRDDATFRYMVESLGPVGWKLFEKAIANFIWFVPPQNGWNFGPEDYFYSSLRLVGLLKELKPEAVWLLGKAHYEPYKPWGFAGTAALVRRTLGLRAVCTYHPMFLKRKGLPDLLIQGWRSL